MSDRKLSEIKVATENDPVLQTAINSPNWVGRIVIIQFRSRSKVISWHVQLTTLDGLLLYRDRIVIPEVLRGEILNTVHLGHLGIDKCRDRANRCVWWPSITSDITKTVQSCGFCQINKPKQRREPLRTSVLPDRQVGRKFQLICSNSMAKII